jgi:hypothetical protein
MKRAGSRLVGAAGLLLIVALFILALPALAQEDEGTTTTTPPAQNLTPAVPIEPAPTPPATPDWTYRYLIPTGLVLAAIVILVTAIRYFTNVVRRRYRIIEE